jgi:polar amino acid transport system substrate-binding protein
MVYKAIDFSRTLLGKPPIMPSKIILSSGNKPLPRAFRSILAAVGTSACILLALTLSGAPTQAQNVVAKPAVAAAPQAVPGFWDPRRRPERPDLSRLTVIRFLTETD